MTATPEDLAKIDTLIAGPKGGPAERIHHWQSTQLSIARHYGAIDFQGHRYVIAVNEPGMPLVRADVLEREEKAAAEKLKADAKAYASLQGGLF